MNLGLIFLTGLSGGVTCLAVQGGLLASAAMSSPLLVTCIFLFSKLLIHLIFGFALGLFGQTFGINDTAQSVLQLSAGIYMLLVAFNLLELHPIFRKVILSPPRFIARFIHQKSKSFNWFTPAILGALTVFLPCGTTLAIESLAVSIRDPIQASLIMGTFVIGTMPMFLVLAGFSSVLTHSLKSKFIKFSVIIIIYLGSTSIWTGMVALGWASPIDSFPSSTNTAVQPSQNAEIVITNSGYSPRYLKVKMGEPVTLTIKNSGGYTCASAFRIPEYNISQNVLAGDSVTVTFTPTKKGKVQFNCSMGMYTGIIEVI